MWSPGGDCNVESMVCFNFFISSFLTLFCHKSHIQNENHSVAIILLHQGRQASFIRPGAVKETLICVNDKWKNTILLSEIYTTHKGLGREREREKEEERKSN